MKVGWSAEARRNEWIRVDLDEGDFTALCYEAGFPLDQQYRIPPVLRYKLLDIETQRLITAKLAGEYGMDSDEAKTRLTELNGERSVLLETLQRIGSVDVAGQH